MQRPARQPTRTRHAAVGFAAAGPGPGVVYARMHDAAAQLLRVAFRLQRYPGLEGREVGYAALAAVAHHLRERGAGRIIFEIDDTHLVRDLNEHREVPPALVLPYVRLGCELNRFESFQVEEGTNGRDLAQRALAEVTMHVAA